MKEILTFPEAAEQVFYEFSHLPIGQNSVVCPYHMNIRKERVGLRALVGKGDPGEIVKEVKVWAKLKDFDLEKATVEQIRQFMIDRSIGIDCSGFVYYVLGFWLKSAHQNRLKNYLIFPNQGLLGWLRRTLRPIENIGANMLTGLDNCERITNLNKVQPGDLIRAKGKVRNSHHVMIVSKVLLVEKKVTEIEYVHATRHYADHNGIRTGKILIKNPGKPLQDQDWTEIEKGRNYTLEDFLIDVEDNGVRRLKRVSLHFDRANLP